MNVFKQLVQSKKTLVDKLFEEVSDYDIYCELTGIEFDVGQSEISPIRLDDDSPSFSLFVPTKIGERREEELWWRDFRDGSGNVFKFTKLYAKLHYSLDLSTMLDTVKFIDTQLELGIFGEGEKKYIKRQIDYEKLKESKEILFTSREFTERDVIWWALIGVDIPLLNRYDVRSLKYLLKYDFTIMRRFSTFELAYAFVVYDKVKVYQPEAMKYKWRNTCPAEYIQGWSQLENKKVLIITKSYKDVLVFKSFMNVDVVAPQSESGSFTSEQLELIKSQYDLVYVVFDYDDAGKIGANKLHDDHGFMIRWVSTNPNLETGKLDDKDISDYYKNHGITDGFHKLITMFPELDDVYFKPERVDYFIKLLQNLNTV